MSTSQLSLYYRPQCGVLSNGSTSSWSETYSFEPARIEAPCDVAEVRQILLEAAEAQTQVKAVGGCASLEAIAVTKGVLLETFKLTSIEEEPRQLDGKRVFWLGAGVTVSQAIEYFREENMALGDNGGWTGQTVVGALNTGTHGTDLDLPPSSDFVRAVHFVMSNGQEVIFEPKSSSRFQVGDFGDNVTLVQDDDEFYSSVVTIGSLGIAVRILYEPLPYYYVFNQMVSTTLPKLLSGQLDEFRAEYDNVVVVINPYNFMQVTVGVRKRFPGSFSDSQSVLENAERELGLQNLSLLDAVDLERIRSATLQSFGFRNAAELIDAVFQLLHANVVPLLDAERFTNLFQNSTADGMNNTFVPPALIFSSAISSFGPTGALGTEIFVPETEMEEFINRTVTFINAGLQERPQPLFLSLRFVRKSLHKLGMSYQRDSVAMEILGLGTRGLVADWAREMKDVFPESRMHWGLEQYGQVDSDYVQARYADGVAQLKLMMEKYDPDGILQTPYVERIFF